MENFEQYLMSNYPDLFYKNESGELECPCGAWVPQGWEKTVDDFVDCFGKRPFDVILYQIA